MMKGATRKPKLFRAPLGLEYEDALYDRIAEAQSAPFSDIHFWQRTKSLVLPKRWTDKPGFELASAEVEAKGWPIFPRRSGGSCVFHGENVLCVTSVFCIEKQTLGIRDGYIRFCDLLIDCLSEAYGVEASYGGCPEAPCDGDFNILIGDRKLAGTAMRRRSRHGKDTFLVHGVIWLSGEMAEPLSVIEGFDRSMGLDVRYPAAGDARTSWQEPHLSCPCKSVVRESLVSSPYALAAWQGRSTSLCDGAGTTAWHNSPMLFVVAF